MNNLKELGNQYFMSGDYTKALESYSQGLAASDLSVDDKLALYKNQSLCLMKLSRFPEVVSVCSKALDISRSDEKSLYRRSVANMQMERVAEALEDARRLLEMNVKSELYRGHVRQIEEVARRRADEAQSLTGRLGAMIAVLDARDERDGQGTRAREDERVKAINNLTVLARETAGGALIWGHNRVKELLIQFAQPTESVAVIEAAQRCLSLMFSSSVERTLEIFKQHGPQYFANMIYSSNADHCRLAGQYLENILSGLTQIKVYRKEKEKYEADMKENSGSMNFRPYPNYKLDESVDKYVNDCLETLLQACNSKKLTATGRDSILEILVRFVPSKEGINWSRKLLYNDVGFKKLLEVGAAAHQTEENPKKSSNISLIDTTHKTKMTVAILLASIYDDLLSDKDREKFRDYCCDFVLDLLTDEILESKVEAANLIGLLFQGPFEAGSAVLAKSGILEGLLLLTKADIASYQRVALDAIVLACTKKDKCLSIVKDAVPILEEIYRTGSDSMKIRALVGMCKLGSAGGRDSSVSCLAEGSNLELAKSCRKFLRDKSLSNNDSSMIRWASEGLAYLTLDAEVKEALVNDVDALQNLLSVTKNTTLECLYPLCTVLANVTNSYDKPEILPEMVELAKYAKQHIPETHEKDNDKYIKARIRALMSHQLPATLYSLTQLADTSPGSQNASKELIARVYLSVVSIEEYKGTVIQAGGGKALISLALKNTDPGKLHAAQALAKIAITIDPRTAFPGQRSLEVIRPLIQLLKIDNTGLQNFESLMALTNLASVDDYHRKRIVKEKGISQIEYYMFEEHEMLRRAATECMCNLVLLDDVKEKFLGEENDRVKLLVLYCAEAEDVALIKASSGALAILSTDARCINKITKVNSWFDIIQAMVACPDKDIQYRATYILTNLIKNGSREFCEFIVNSNMLEIIMALSKLTEESLKNVVTCAEECLDVLVQHQLIKPIN